MKFASAFPFIALCALTAGKPSTGKSIDACEGGNCAVGGGEEFGVKENPSQGVSHPELPCKCTEKGCSCHHNVKPEEVTEPGEEQGCRCRGGEKGCTCHHNVKPEEMAEPGVKEIGLRDYIPSEYDKITQCYLKSGHAADAMLENGQIVKVLCTVYDADGFCIYKALEFITDAGAKFGAVHPVTVAVIIERKIEKSWDRVQYPCYSAP
ncbi:unnamed protein product [Vitrella brassicaformis CCMP3155]|uniref:Uncharacterized protein n=1 Tax=Vitrella brassicaformis (strain CCMP3155) TaxID=1169540 RepID=A0A0G4ERX7_VITBC|nr:unnamed protein product [Vitrella brassicaformis CCMP3155]|eukprot:CEL99988.1 unnamed protein product [Vitrella brassicaformis CCMP3155]